MQRQISPYKLIYSSAELLKIVSKWKNNGDKLVFTNGCFDVLHRGHAEYLHKAGLLGDKLIVGLNSDASVIRLKGEDRPVNDENARAFLLASLKIVDAVCVFEEDTPLNLIKLINPDFLVKGGDYIVEDIVGYEHLMSYGGKIITIPLVDGYSSTNIIEKM
ncbi:MAG: D-glycero-beta-D-manno-heptose 1-phosphate adenylyltransferase [Bacteroidales bacterium]|nr:D-glycero-beta-D-manno-heptose 1-phosphate adenylyltransferase [Bacteroidales bacterium]